MTAPAVSRLHRLRPVGLLESLSLVPAAPADDQRIGPAPPQNLDAEEMVIGACLLAPAAVAAAAEIVAPQDFYYGTHGRIFEAIVALWAADRPVDPVTLVDDLASRGWLEGIGGASLIQEIYARVPAAGNAVHYARIVREHAVARELIRAGSELVRLGHDRQGRDAAGLVEEAERLVFDVARRRRDDHDFADVSATVRAAHQRIVELHDGTATLGLETGYRDLDRILVGIQPDNLVILAARPSIGKSAMMLGVVAHTAVHKGLPVVLFSLEMSELEVTNRLIGIEARVDSVRLRTGRLEQEDWHRVNEACARLERAPIYLDDSGLITLAEIRSKTRRLKLREPGLALVAVDYLQLMTSGGSQESRVQEISAISRGLKVLAKELEVPVLALSQLSRQPEQRHDKRPILSDLRESGAIEQDADIVAFVYRDSYYNPESAAEDGTEGIAEVNVAKHRNGPTETVKLAFVKKWARFGDLVLTGDVGGPR